MRITLVKVLGAACAAAVLAGCEGSTSPEKLDPVGTVRFSYRGALTGTYEAMGELQVQAGTVPQPATGATAYRQDSTLAVLAFRSAGGTRGDGFTLLLGPLKSTGSVAFDPVACQGAVTSGCRVGAFAPGLDAAALGDPARLAAGAYILAIGSVNVTRLSKVRLRGTFSGTAVPLSNPTLQNTISITNGEFDVPIPPP
jgi:hypothetical protein